jgi:SOS-response transcriptional repressor LexA
MAFSWNSELPSGHNPFWIRDEALADVGVHTGEAVSVDTQREPVDGDLVVVEVELDDDSLRMARRYFDQGDRVRLTGDSVETVEVAKEAVMVLGVIAAKLRMAEGALKEEPLQGHPA